MPLYGVAPTPAIALLPVWLVLFQLLALGLGLYAGALSVSYRDVIHILPVGIQLLLYASPVAYGLSSVPHKLQTLYLLNPLAGLLAALRWSLLGGTPPGWGHVAYSAVMSCALLMAGAFAFQRMERRFADVI
jgi:lipopolysaccharide transport system permease protein